MAPGFAGVTGGHGQEEMSPCATRPWDSVGSWGSRGCGHSLCPVGCCASVSPPCPHYSPCCCGVLGALLPSPPPALPGATGPPSLVDGATRCCPWGLLQFRGEAGRGGSHPSPKYWFRGCNTSPTNTPLSLHQGCAGPKSLLPLAQGRKMLPPTPESLWFVIYTHQQPNYSQIQPGSPGRLCMCPRAQGGYKRAAPGTHHRARPCHRGKQNLPKSLGATGPQWVGSGMSPGAQGARGWGGGQLGTQHGHPAFQPPPPLRRAPAKPRCHGRVGPASVEEGGGEPQVPAGLQAGDVLQDDT